MKRREILDVEVSGAVQLPDAFGHDTLERVSPQDLAADALENR